MILKAPINGQGSASGSAGLVAPVTIVMIVIVLGATIYLRRTGYIRRNTAYVMILCLLVALIAAGYWNYSFG